MGGGGAGEGGRENAPQEISHLKNCNTDCISLASQLPVICAFKRLNVPRGFSTCGSTQCAVLKIFFEVQTEDTCNSQAYYIVTIGCKKVNSSEIGRFRYGLIGGAQTSINMLEVVACKCPLRQN